MSLEGKRVVIVGGSSGIGLATARAALAAGAKVLIASRSQEKLREAKEEADGKPGTHVLDVTDENQIREFFAKVRRFDHLVLTSVTGMTGKFQEQDLAKVQELFASKFWGQFLCARFGAPCLEVGGSITFFSGVASEKPLTGFSAYAAVNGAINALVRTLAVELAPLRVNAVSPGIVETPAYDAMPEEKRRKFFDSVAAKLPVRRIGRPEDIAAAVMYLMTNGYVTGSVLDVDGGGRLV